MKLLLAGSVWLRRQFGDLFGVSSLFVSGVRCGLGMLGKLPCSRSSWDGWPVYRLGGQRSLGVRIGMHAMECDRRLQDAHEGI